MLFVSVGAGQVKKPTPKPATMENSEESPSANADVEDKGLVADFNLTKGAIFVCYNNFFNSKDENNSKDLNDCLKLKSERLAEIFGQLTKRPNAIKLLISQELDTYYKYDAARLAGVRRTEVEININSQTELQRIIVIQNQRIIELLEILTKQKK